MSVTTPLVPFENVSGIDLFLDIVQGGVVAVSYDGIALGLEGSEVIHHLGAKESSAVFQRGLVDNHLGTLGLDALHNALDGALAEVVRV